jgi:histone chaperone ASF1
MAAINITNVVIQNNPAPFLAPFHLQITFECLKELTEGKIK